MNEYEKYANPKKMISHSPHMQDFTMYCNPGWRDNGHGRAPSSLFILSFNPNNYLLLDALGCCILMHQIMGCTENPSKSF
jgi:hypothetical protein